MDPEGFYSLQCRVGTVPHKLLASYRVKACALVLGLGGQHEGAYDDFFAAAADALATPLVVAVCDSFKDPLPVLSAVANFVL